MLSKKPILSLKEIFNALDIKDYWFYGRIGEEKRKTFNSYMQLKYNASATGSSDLQEYMIRSTNEELNKDFWEISKHPKLVWMILCAINPKIGSFNRKYLPMKKNVKDNNAGKIKFLSELYPTWKLNDIEAYAEMCDKKELKQLAIEHGYDDKSIRERL
jgi:hypothetical protein